MPEERTDEAYLQWKADNQKNENDYISSRWSQLYELEKEWGTLAVKYIILLNSGGAVATLGFIGSAGAANVPQQAKWALLFFVFGIVLGGTIIAHANHTIPARFNNWRTGVKKYRASKSDKRFDELLQLDENALDYDDEGMDQTLGHVSFACFIIGCIVGAVGLFNPSISKDTPVEQVSQNTPATTHSAKLFKIEP